MKKLRVFVTCRLVLNDMLQEVFQAEEKFYQKETWNFNNEGRAKRMGKYWGKCNGLFFSQV